MTLDPLLPPAVVIPLGLALLGLAIWRLVADRAHRLAWGLRTGAAALVVLALAGPGVPGGRSQEVATEVNVYLVVDTTLSAAARDYDGDRERLEGYREDVAQIADAMPGARFSIISFDEEARVAMPLTTDHAALRTAMETLTPVRSLLSAGSSITVAESTLTAALERSAERFPERARVVFYLGDGEQTADEQPGEFTSSELVDGGAVLGYGTAKGGPMEGPDLDDVPGGEDVEGPSGEVGLSVIDEQALQQIAERLGVPYVHREGGDIAPALAEADPGEVTAAAGDEVGTSRSIVWLLALGAIALLGLDVLLLARELSRARPVASSSRGRR